MMTRSIPIVAVLALLAGLCAGPMHAAEMTSEQILAEATAHAKARYGTMKNDFRHRSWKHGTFWIGAMELAKVVDDPDLDRVLERLCRSRGVRIGVGALERHDKDDPHHADDMCIGQVFLDYAIAQDAPEVGAPVTAASSAVADYILSDDGEAAFERFDALGTHEGLTWSWVDALFMAAPLHARLTQHTGDAKYLDSMVVEWQRVNARLWDADRHLYYRDKSYLTKRSRSGGPVFWGRGNGWVMGAFARTIPLIPDDHPQRPWFIERFQEMSAALAAIQRPDGTWSPSLIDYEHFPYSELSVTAFACFGMAWGINQGYLDEATYRPIVTRAWAAMLAAENEDGLMGYVQGVGAEPAPVDAHWAALYGEGAFMLAAIQLTELAPLEMPAAPALTGRIKE